MNNTPVTYFDVCSALRDRRELRFILPNGSELIGVPTSIRINSRSNREFLAIIVGDNGTQVSWHQDNLGNNGQSTIIHEVG